MLYDAIIIGGGAAGLMAGCALSRAGRRVILLEKQNRVGRKLLSTGNGRCNLTNLNAGLHRYHGAREAAQYALETWPPERMMAQFARLGIPCVPDAEGRVYPMSRQAASVLDALRLCCDENGVETRTEFPVAALARSADGFIATAADGRTACGKCALVCAGGLAAPKLGAGGDGHRLLEALGHASSPRFPAIVPLKTPPEPVRGLKGIRAAATLALYVDGRDPKAQRGQTGSARVAQMSGRAVQTESGELLFAEDGLSGIAAMQLARSVNEALRAGKRCAVRINFVAGEDAGTLLTARARHLPARRMEDFLNGIVPKRLGQTLVRAAGIDQHLTASQLDAAGLMRLTDVLQGWTLSIIATHGFEQAQVTAGGVRLDGFDKRTMGSRIVPGLFAAGEVLDVDGDCGGYNLHWAWASALLAAEGICAHLSS